MNAGSLRFVVNIQRETRVADTLGGFTSTWFTVYSGVDADIRQPSGSDIFKFGKLVEKFSTIITIRFNKAIRAGWQVSYNGHSYPVKYAMNKDMRFRETVLFCDETI
jgi:SPP1 family predicted phage head-tail adaptor